MKDFRQLTVWQAAHELALDIYRRTKYFPHEERYGLIDQMRRAAVSIPTNIAEGCGRASDADCHTRLWRLVGLGFARFVQIAFGSACELESLLLLSRDLGLLAAPDCELVVAKLVSVKRMLAALLKKLKADG
jgi:hypothetical protein